MEDEVGEDTDLGESGLFGTPSTGAKMGRRLCFKLDFFKY